MASKMPQIQRKPVLPVFVKQECLPQNCRTSTVCKACEEVSGKGSIDGATCCNGLWRILPFNEISRAKLLTNGITLNDKKITFCARNPFLMNSGAGESQGTTLFIDNLPFSLSMDAVERSLAKEGYKLRGSLRWLKGRWEDGSLTNSKIKRDLLKFNLNSIRKVELF